MSRNYDNWERLVDAVLRKELLWRICHEQSRTTSLRSSTSSDFSSSFSSTTASFNFANPRDGFRSALPLPFQTVAGVKTNLKLMSKKNLVFFEDSLLAFGLEELLIAPCFVLGDEIDTFTSIYVVNLNEDVNFVVRRWRIDNDSREMLNRKLNIIKSLNHENIFRLSGLFISDQDGSFGIYDYFHQGSLHSMLHGIKCENKVDLDWEVRIRIAIGAAKGLLHIHRGQGGNFVHGSVKASYVFLNSEQYGCLDVELDYTVTVENRMCHAPEVHVTKDVSQAGDVYSFGVLLIELVSGRSPLHYTGRHKTYADWGLHNARDELATNVFDREQCW
ncbi:hypothetical protein ACS0TY_004650 [Phlomoides rotata]